LVRALLRKQEEKKRGGDAIEDDYIVRS